MKENKQALAIVLEPHWLVRFHAAFSLAGLLVWAVAEVKSMCYFSDCQYLVYRLSLDLFSQTFI